MRLSRWRLRSAAAGRRHQLALAAQRSPVESQKVHVEVVAKQPLPLLDFKVAAV
jgi:hypothetical protein